MTGDVEDIVRRLRSVIPKGWFGEQSPNLSAILRSFATPWVWLFSLLAFVQAQSRVSSASDMWLDLIAQDYLGANCRRKPHESDTLYRVRLRNLLLPHAATRSALAGGVERLTGAAPAIFEPSNCGDTGSYGSLAATSPGLAYGVQGGWGSLTLPNQFFINVGPPAINDASAFAGYGTGAGGYGTGHSAYLDLSLVPGRITDQDIQTTICRFLPIGAVAWLRIT